MITREIFLKTIEVLAKHREFEDDLNRVLHNYCPDSTIFCTNLETVVVNLLEEGLQDKEGWISYVLYELDFLKNYEYGCVTDKDSNNIIDISTFEKLYDFLIENMKKN